MNLDGNLAVSARLFSPMDVFVDDSGNLFIADYNHNRVRRVSATTGIIETVAGNGNAGFSGDGGPATEATLGGPTGVVVDNNIIRRPPGGSRERC